MTTVTLNATAVVKLDGSGNGTAQIGPNAHGVIWHPEVVQVKVSTFTKSATCLIYSGGTATDVNFVDGTYNGALNASDNIRGQVLHLGDQVFAVWTGGDANAQATLTVSGTKEV